MSITETFDIKQITQLLPHRYPFLLIDKVISLEKGKSVTAIKNVTINEPFFVGHFPSEPVMPGVMILEALAQAGILIVADPLKEQIYYFLAIDKAKFRQPVIPGDQLVLKVSLIVNKGRFWKAKGEAFVQDKLVAEAILTASMKDKKDIDLN